MDNEIYNKKKETIVKNAKKVLELYDEYKKENNQDDKEQESRER